MEYSICYKNHIRMSGYNLEISVIRLTQSMPFHMLDSVLYLTNIKNEIEWIWLYLLNFTLNVCHIEWPIYYIIRWEGEGKLYPLNLTLNICQIEYPIYYTKDQRLSEFSQLWPTHSNMIYIADWVLYISQNLYEIGCSYLVLPTQSSITKPYHIGYPKFSRIHVE